MNFFKQKLEKPVPIEGVFNPKHFDMRLEIKHIMVLELWFNSSNGFANVFFNKNIDFWKPVSISMDLQTISIGTGFVPYILCENS